jgi:hypothetical protein
MQILTTEQLSDFLEYGFSTLPQLKLSDSAREKIKMLAIDQNQIYAESDKVLEIIFSDTKALNKVGQDLSIFSSKALNRNIPYSKGNFYSIIRCTTSNQKTEAFLGHFDSHICTIVIPVQIPRAKELESGELVLFPNVRDVRESKLKNLYKKISFQRYKNRPQEIQALERKYNKKIFNFRDNNPIIFHGFNSFHWNLPFYGAEDRITILIHYYDPDKFGLGKILRIIRNR